MFPICGCNVSDIEVGPVVREGAPPAVPPHFSPSCRPTIRHCTMAPIQRCLPPRATIAPAPDQHAHINKAHWAGTRP